MVKMNNFQKIKSFFSNNKFPILIFFGLSFAISLTFPTGFSIRYSYQLNDIANEPIIAPFDFGILKTDQKLNKDLGLSELSMGMSSDYLIAAKNFSTYVRVGSSIFGQRS